MPFPLLSLYVFSFFSAFKPCSPRILPGNHRAKHREGARPHPERAGDAYLAEREHPRKSIYGPHSLHISLVPRTHCYGVLTTAGNFLPPRGPTRGCKNTRTHTHCQIPPSDFTHEHDVSRRNPPEGRTKKIIIIATFKTALPQRPKKYYYLRSIPNNHHQHSPPATYCETRASRVSILYIYPDFSRQRKELSRSRENRMASQQRPSSKNSSPFPQSKYL